MSTTADGSSVVELRGVSVIRDGVEVVSGVDWTVGTGERWVLFGANGSGKTTLLEVVSTYLHPARGTAEILGAPLGSVDVRTLRSRIGYVGPAPASMVRTSFRVLDIVVTGLHASFVGTRWHTYEEGDWEHARRCLRSVHAEDLGERVYATLSEGQKKRALIARSLMADPDLLLLDEPGSGLDLGARERLVDALATLAVEPGSPPAVLVTHHVEEIPPGFDHILMLAGGRVVAAGAIEEVLTSESLSATFEMPLELERRGNRWRAWSPRPG